MRSQHDIRASNRAVNTDQWNNPRTLWQSDHHFHNLRSTPISRDELFGVDQVRKQPSRSTDSPKSYLECSKRQHWFCWPSMSNVEPISSSEFSYLQRSAGCSPSDLYCTNDIALLCRSWMHQSSSKNLDQCSTDFKTKYTTLLRIQANPKSEAFGWERQWLPAA